VTATTSGTFRAGAFLLGLGLGGLADGILFHQVLQWHNLVAEPLPPDTLEALRTNVFWDGVFHVVDQLLFHELLDLHDIRMGVPTPGLYNRSYGASGVLLIALGWWVLRGTREARGGRSSSRSRTRVG
jgi:uncharacterized membrane protein